MEKKCPKCGKTKLFSEFHKKSKNAKGLKPRCKECIKEDSAAYYEKHKEKISAKAAKYFQENKDKLLEKMKKWHEQNPAAHSVYSSKRRAQERKAAPPWLTEQDWLFIKCRYQVAEMRSRCDDMQWHVDHIVPLRGKKVCGLHVPWNLRVIPAVENLRKGNKFVG